MQHGIFYCKFVVNRYVKLAASFIKNLPVFVIYEGRTYLICISP